MNRRKMAGAAILAMSIVASSGVSVYAEDDVNATVIWRAFDDQFQSGFRIIMGNEEENMGGIKLDMQLSLIHICSWARASVKRQKR